MEDTYNGRVRKEDISWCGESPTLLPAYVSVKVKPQLKKKKKKNHYMGKNYLVVLMASFSTL
jgi:hypothetical protein